MKVLITYGGKVYESFKDIQLIQKSKGYKITFSIVNNDSSPVDLTEFTTAYLELQNVISEAKKTINLSITNPTNGVIEWEVSDTHTNDNGVYFTELTISDTDKIYKFHCGALTIIKEI